MSVTELETVLQSHDWSLDGYATRPQLDRLIKNHTDFGQATALWEQYCPWSDANGGYISWVTKRFHTK
jgi:hypothetical protein